MEKKNEYREKGVRKRANGRRWERAEDVYNTKKRMVVSWRLRNDDKNHSMYIYHSEDRA
jgi:hypothetical protein